MSEITLRANYERIEAAIADACRQSGRARSEVELMAVSKTYPPEALAGGTVDLGAIAAEFLILGIDPYPRKAGAVFSSPPGAEASAHPFDALAALKKPR